MDRVNRDLTTGATSEGALIDAWNELIRNEPKIRIRDAAQRLGVSELALLQTKQGKAVTRLEIEPKAFAELLSDLGPVMSLTRNDACVHEVTGCFAAYKASPSPVGLFLGEQDLRIFFAQWHYLYAVSDNGRQSFQVFDEFGVAVIKVYAKEQTNLAKWEALISTYRAADQSTRVTIDTLFVPQTPIANADPDVAALREGWMTMSNIHQFQGLLKTLALSRSEAFALVGDDVAVPLSVDSVEYVLREASDTDIPTIEFVQNRGVVQIHTAVNRKLVTMGKWFNVLDPDFNLHLDTTAIEQVWAVKRPGDTGMVSSIEAFDCYGRLIIQIFGQRTEGQQQRQDWEALVDHCMNSRQVSVMQAEAAAI